MSAGRRRVGIVGFGHLGQYLYTAITEDPKVSAVLEVAFVWNRTADKVASAGVPPALVCVDLTTAADFTPDIIAEVCHPDIASVHGPSFLAIADVFLGSPTAFADPTVETALRTAAASGSGFGVYVPCGALWGGPDIQKMADRGTLTALTITMKKHPASMKLTGPLQAKLEAATAVPGEVVLYEGSVRELCPMAPNNVNTMAAAAIAGHNLGFDKTRAVLVSDNSLNAHVIDVEVTGTPGFSVTTRRINPAAPGAVTGNATYASFLSSLLGAKGRGNGIHMC